MAPWAESDQPAFINKLICFLLKVTTREVLEDSLAEVEMIQASGQMLTDERGTGKIRVGYVNSDMGRTLSREDFAELMLKQIENDEWLGKMPAVSN